MHGGAKAAGMVVSGVLSAGAALVLVCKVVTPRAIGAVGTVELVGLLLLLGLPVACAWAYRKLMEATGRGVEAGARRLVGEGRVGGGARGGRGVEELRKAA